MTDRDDAPDETTASALDKLGRMVDASGNPPLTREDLNDLLEDARLPDALGRRPGMDGYAPTFDLNRAAMEGWRRKAGRVAGNFSFSADNANYNKGEVLAHMEAMVAQYAAKVHGSTAMAPPPRDDYDTSGLIP